MNYGTVTSAKISIDANFCSRGFGFVTYESSKASQKAIEEANGKSLSELTKDGDESKKLVVTEYLSK